MAFLFAMENIRVHIPKKLYAKSFDEGWLSSMALFVFLAKSHSGKTYYFPKNQKTKFLKELGAKHKFGLTTFLKHIKILSDNNLISFTENSMSLVKKKDLFPTSKKLGRLFVPDNISSYNDIKTFLLSLPVLSNLCLQEKVVKRIQHFIYLNELSKLTRHKDFTNKARKSLENYKNNGGKMQYNNELFLSIKGFGELIERKAKNTITKYKNFLKEKGLIKVSNVKERVYNFKISFTDYLTIKKNEILNGATFYFKGFVYLVKPSMYILSYRR